MGICYYCGKEVEILYRCPFCNVQYCADHRLPEQHNCSKMPDRSWDSYRDLRTGRYSVLRGKESKILRPRKREDKTTPIKKKTPSRSPTPSNTDENKPRSPHDHHPDFTYTQYLKDKRNRKIKKILISSLLISTVLFFSLCYVYPTEMESYLQSMGLPMPNVEKYVNEAVDFLDKTVMKYFD